MLEDAELLERFVRSLISEPKSPTASHHIAEICSRIAMALKLLPDDERDTFVSGRRKLSVEIVREPKIPFGMKTRSTTGIENREYTIFVCEECGEWEQNRFLGALFHEFGHIISEIPPEEEWPITRGDRARFKEYRELLADCVVWKWGLRHYDVSYLIATFPPHWVDRIITDIEKLMATDDRFK